MTSPEVITEVVPVSEANPDGFLSGFIDGIDTIIGGVETAIDLAEASETPGGSALKLAPGVGLAVSGAVVARQVDNGDLRGAWGTVGSMVAGAGATIIVTGAVVGGATLGAPVAVLAGTVLIMTAGATGQPIGELAYDGVQWLLRPPTPNRTLPDLLTAAGISPDLIEDGFRAGDLVDLDDLVKLDGGQEIALNHSSYYKYNESFANIWEISDLGVDQAAFEAGLAKYINYLVQSGRNVHTTDAVFSYYEALADLNERGRLTDAESFNNYGYPFSELENLLYSEENLSGFTFREDACFAAGTPVLMSDGTYKPIEAVEVGDYVATFDEKSVFGQIVSSRVTKTFATPDRSVVDLEGLKVTLGHMMLSGSGKFHPLADILKRQETLVLADGTPVRAPRALDVPDSVSVHNFEVDGTHTYVAGEYRVHNRSLRSYLQPGEVLTDSGVDSSGVEFTESIDEEGTVIVRRGYDEDGVPGTDVIEESHSYESGDGVPVVVTEHWRKADGNIDSAGVRQGDGELSIPDWNGQFINYQQLGGIFGSALGNYLANNDFERIAYGGLLSSVFHATGKSIDIFENGFEHKSGTAVDSLDESIDIAFADFGARLAGGIVSRGIGTASTFLASEIIGGSGLAADLGRTVASNFISSSLTDLAVELAADTFAEGIIPFLGKSVQTPVSEVIGFDPFSAIGGFFGSSLANGIVQPTSKEAALVSSVLQGVTTSVLTGFTTGSLGTIGSAFTSAALSIGTAFIGAFVGTLFGNALGNLLFNDEDWPRAVKYVGIDGNGRAIVAGGGAGLDGMSPADVHVYAEAVANGYNGILDLLGPGARMTSAQGTLAAVGYIALPGYRGADIFPGVTGFVLGRPGMSEPIWNQSGFDPSNFESAYEFALKQSLVAGEFTGGDAFGRRILNYGGWNKYGLVDLEEFVGQLKIADEYRRYLADKEVIDRLIAEAPDSAFAVGWIATLAQAYALDLHNPNALHEKIDGTANSEALHGTQYNDEISAVAGNDALYGYGGNDLLRSGTGADYIHGGDGLDTVSYRDSAGAVTIDLAAQTVSGGSGNGDTLVSIERAMGSAYGDTISGTDNDDILAGLGGNDAIYGRGGDDTIEGGAGADTLDGGDGFDIASYATSSTGVKVHLDGTAGEGGDAAGDVLTNFEAINGSQFSDMLIGSFGDDLLVGNDGSDFLIGGAGADRLIGGEGNDFADYSESDAGVTVDLVTSTATGGHAEGDALVEIESIIGSAYADTITGDAFSNIIEGGAGADTLDGAGGQDAISYAESDSGITINLLDNTVSGGHGDGDTISNFESVIATNFDDHITVRPTENTVVLAGDGDDVIRVEDGGTFIPGSQIRIDGGAGVDEADFAALSGGVNVQPLYANAGFFFGYLWGGTTHVNFGNDLYNVWETVRAGGQVVATDFTDATNDYEVGVDSVEIIAATRFDDIIDFDDNVNQQIGDLGFFAQALNGGAGNDTIRTRSGHDYVKGGAGNDVITGDLGNDQLFGGEGNDTIYGDGSEEIHSFQFGGLFGFGSGASSYQDMVDRYTPYGAHDRLDGGAGNDHLEGGFGDDTYVFGRGYGSDTIYDHASVSVPSPDPKSYVGTQQMVHAGSDTIELASGIDLDDLDFLYERGDLTIRIRGTSDQITVKNWIDANHRIETIRFADTGAAHTIASLDVVARQVAEHSTHLASTYNEHHHATSLLSSAWGDANTTPRFLEDVNGDGMADLLGVVGQSVYLAYGQIDGTFSTTHTFANLLNVSSPGSFRYLGDVDGDGDADLVGFASPFSNTGGAFVHRYNGTGFDAVSAVGLSGNIDHNWNSEDRPLNRGSHYNNPPEWAHFVVDVNGDGKADFIEHYSRNFDVASSTATSAGVSAYMNPTISLDLGYISLSDEDVLLGFEKSVMGDVTGNGQAELVAFKNSGVFVYNAVTGAPVGSTNQFTGAQGWGGKQRLLSDVNGDGRDDIVGFHENGVHVAFSLGNGTFSSATNMYAGFSGANWGAFGSNQILAGDVNGDGYGDFAAVAADGVHVAIAKPFRTIGTRFNDILIGNGSTPLIGFEGNDVITGSAANETVIGGYGADQMNGGAGIDTLSYVSSQEGVSVDLQHGQGSSGEAQGDTFSSFENVTGSSYNDVIYSNAVANTIDGGDGIDQADYRFSNAAVQINLAAGTAAGGFAAGDVLTNIENVYGTAFNDTLIGDDGNNTLWGHLGANHIEGRAGHDSMVGGDGDDTILGGDGNDTLRGMAGADYLDGGEGIDTVRYDWATGAVTVDMSTATPTLGGAAAGDTLLNIENVVGSQYNDTLTGSHSSEGLWGGDGADLLYGNNGNDSLYGDAGDDNLFGQEGADHIDGGAGVDTASYSGSWEGINVNLTTGQGSGGTAEGDVLVNIEQISGSIYDDVLTADAGTNTLWGWAGNDILTGGEGADTLHGGEGVDTVSYATSASGVTVDLVSGTGSAGDALGDTLTDIEDLIGSNSGTDWLYGNDASNTIQAGGGNDVLYGRAGDDHLYGGAGMDLLFGGAGADTLDGGAESDAVSYQDATGAVTIDLSQGTAEGAEAQGDTLISIERLYGSAFDDSLTGNAADNELHGEAGNDTLTGGAGDDSLFGGDGNDTLSGGDGSDSFRGGAGADVLDGGAGGDIAWYDDSTAGVTVDLALASTQSGGYAEGDVLSGFENLGGSSYDDVLSGDDNANVIVGGDGADTIYGHAGGDALYGDGGDDTIFGGTDDDTIDGGAGADGLHGDAGNDVLSGGAGNDSFVGGSGADVIDGGADSDTARYDNSSAGVTLELVSGQGFGGDAEGDTLIDIENFVGSGHNDHFYSSTTAESFDGGDGTDLIRYDNSTAVTINLQAGTGLGGYAQGDTFSNIEGVVGSAFNDTLTGSTGDDVLYGSAGDDSFFGGIGNDQIYGGDGSDVLTGWDGDDYLEGGAGADTLDGGDGVDTVSYASSTELVSVNLNNGNVAHDGFGSSDTLVNIENVIGSSYNDVIYSGAGANRIDGADGSDWARYEASTAAVQINLAAGTASGGYAAGDVLISISNLHGGHYNDTLIGDAGNNTIYGGWGANHIEGGAGNDSFVGGDGNDTILGGDDNDVLRGMAGADVLDGGAGTDAAYYDWSTGGVTIDLQAGTGAGAEAQGDTLISIERVVGSAHDDALYASVSGSTLEGNAGADNLIGNAGIDVLVGGDGIDSVNYSYSDVGVSVDLSTGAVSGGHAEGDTISGFESIAGSLHADTLTGDSGNNRLFGWDGDDTLIGGAGDDLLEGKIGNDVLEGGAGADTLDGGDGVDTASYAGSAERVIVDIATGYVAHGDAVGDTLVSIENLTGSDFADQLMGNAGANVLTGGLGDDVLSGASGADTLDGGEGSDWAWYSGSSTGVQVNLATGIYSGDGAAGDTLISIENLYGSSHADVLTGDAGDNVLDGFAGADALDGGAGVDTAMYVYATAGVTIDLQAGTGAGAEAQGDTLTNIENVIGSEHLDTIIGDGSNNSIHGGGGDDHLRGQGGADYIDGGAGTDTANYDASSAGVTVNLTTNVNLGGDAQGDQLVNIEKVGGSTHNDTLTGDAGANTLWGNAGDDVLEGGAGADYLDGGEGVDTAVADSSSGPATVYLETGTIVYTTGPNDTLVSIENIVGTLHNDVIYSGVGANHIDGGAGQDQIDYRHSTAAVQINLLAGTADGGSATGDVIVNGENVHGTAFNDTLIGDDGNNTLWGHLGANHIDGGAGNDSLVGGDGNDTIFGGTGNDTIDGGAGADGLHGDTGDDTLFGGAGNDTFLGGSGADAIDGGADFDYARYDNSAAAVTIDLVAGTGTGGDAEGDTLTSIEGLVGSAHDDTFVSSAAGEHLNGTGGFDFARYDNSTSGVTVNLGTNSGSGGYAQDDALYNIEGVVGSAHADTLTGDVGNNTFEGGAGGDTLDGGAGIDTASYAGSGEGVTVDLSTGTGQGGHAEGDVLASIENISGSAYADSLIGDAGDNVIWGHAGDDFFLGGAGADTLYGGDGVDTASYATSTSRVNVNLTGSGFDGDAEGDWLVSIENVIGTSFNDAFGASAAANVIDGGGGIDVANYFTSDTGVSVDLGSSTASGGHAEGDVLISIENLSGSTHADTLTGDEQSNTIWGQSGNDLISGGGGHDNLFGNDGDDVLRGGAGNDTLRGHAGADTLDGGEGIDTVRYDHETSGVHVDLSLTTAQVGGASAGDVLLNIEQLMGSAFDDTLSGNSGDNYIDGSGGNDIIFGGDGNDDLEGGAGDDTLIGGAGADTLRGGDGTDTASYAAASSRVSVNLAGGGVVGEAQGDWLISIENIIGSSFDDAFSASVAANVIDGGDGRDQVNYQASDAGVSIDLASGSISGGYAQGDTLISIEDIRGSEFADTLVGDDQGNAVWGQGGNDTISGGAGHDNLFGNDGNDILQGGAGNDTLRGHAGADVLDGGEGIDRARYDHDTAAVHVDLSLSTAQVGGASEGDVLISIEQLMGSAFDDTLLGNDGGNYIDGYDGNDVIAGRAGNDGLYGGLGDDSLDGGLGADILDGGEGFDTATYETSSGGVSVDLLTGTGIGGDAQGDTLTAIEGLVGSGFDDTLSGNNSANRLEGGAGGDVLHGRGGSDILIGGSGTDAASYDGTRADYDVMMNADGTWQVTDLSTGDIDTLTDIESAVFSGQTISLTNTAPTVTQAVSGQQATEDALFNFVIPSATFQNDDAAFGDTLTLSATLSDGTALPAWLSFDAASGTFSGTPDNGDVGGLSIKVTATDMRGLSVDAPFALTVINTNDAPTADVALANQVAEDAQSFSFAVPAGTFSDVDAGDALTLNAILTGGGSLPAWLSFDPATGTFTGTPGTGDIGSLAVDVVATDLSGASATNTFTLTVDPANQAPVVIASSVNVDEGQSVTVDLSAYASDPEGRPLSYSLTSAPAVGTTTLVGHMLTYDAAIGAFGPQSIGFTVTDDRGLVTSGTTDVTVENINFDPTLAPAAANVDEGQEIPIDLAAYASDLDGDTLTYSLGAAPATGTANLNGSILTYTSTIGGYGNVPVAFTVSDGLGGSTSGAVDVTVNNINFAPTAAAGSHNVDWAGTISVDLAPLVADLDGDVLSFGLSQGPASGSASMTGSILTYTSAASVGTNAITYSVSDGAGGVAHSTVSFTTLPQPNSAPVAVNDTFDQGGYTGSFWLFGGPGAPLSNDYDPDGHAITLQSIGGVAGSIVGAQINYIEPGGAPVSFSWTWSSAITGAAPGSVFHGSFDYTIVDSLGAQATATVNVSYTVPAPITKPIVLDMDGDGIELVNADDADIFFDVNGDGEAERTGWAAADDGLLVFDKDMDGAAADIDEISFVGYKEGARTDLEGLRAFDTNGDGLLDSGDAQFGQFKVWRDANQDGISQKGELVGLTAAGISAIELTSDETVRVVGDNISFGTGAYHRTDGSTGLFSDTGFGGAGMSIDADALDAVEVAAADAGFGGGNDAVVHQLRAGLDEVLETGGAAGLLDTPTSSTGAAVVLNNAMTGLVSAMAAFDAQAAGQSSLSNRPEDNATSHQLAAWVS